MRRFLLCVESRLIDIDNARQNKVSCRDGWVGRDVCLPLRVRLARLAVMAKMNQAGLAALAGLLLLPCLLYTSSLGIAYEIREYEVDPEDLSAIAVARKIGLPAEQVFKTLLTKASSGEYLFAVVPGDCELDLKKLAAAAEMKKVELASLCLLYTSLQPQPPGQGSHGRGLYTVPHSGGSLHADRVGRRQDCPIHLGRSGQWRCDLSRRGSSDGEGRLRATTLRRRRQRGA